MTLLTKADFTPHLGRVFTADNLGQSFILERIEGEDTKASATVRAPFTLIFRTPKTLLVPEGLHQCRIEGGPMVELYIVPIHSPGARAQDYQAVFN